MKKTFCISVILFFQILFIPLYSAITANPIISRGKPVYTSSGNASYLVDNNFTGTAFNVSSGSWVAINIGTGHSSVFFTWNNPNYSWSDVISAAHSCKQNLTAPTNYTIQKSLNSTNGSDGQWTTMATITDNVVTNRGHQIDVTGASWIRMNISSGGGSISEIEVFDLSTNGTDLWFFPGTSISANTFKGTVPALDFVDLVHQSYAEYTPAMIRGGIPCISSGDLVTDISRYMAAAGNVKYWAIEMGTNDAWGGGNGNVTSYKNNMQAVINACKAAGIQPILSRMIGTNQSAAGWQVHPDFLKAIDDLTIQNNLITGPDFYTWFTGHTSELNSDGVHPNATGAASIQRLWAQKMTSLYTITANTAPAVTITSPTNNTNFIFPGSITISANATDSDGTISNVQFYNGTTLLNTDVAAPYTYAWTNATAGTYSITAKTTDNSGATAVSTAVTVTVTACTPTAITPSVQINDGTWNPVTTVSVPAGSSLILGPQPVTGGSWTWTGPDNFTATTREANFPAIQATQAGNYIASYTNSDGCKSTITFAVTVPVNSCTPTPIVPYVQTDGVTWLQQATAKVCAGSTVVLGPQPTVDAGWSWTGPNNFTAVTREITVTNLTVDQSGVYTATYKNATGCLSTSQITLTVNALPVVSNNVQLNGGTWNPLESASICAGGNIGLGPLPVAATGWSWTGPNGFTNAAREIQLAAVAQNQSGIYKSTYVDENGCKASINFSLIVNALPSAPTVSTPVIYCQNTTTATVLSATGVALRWYTSSTALMDAPVPLTTASGTTNYYVTQTINSCESSRSLIAVTVNTLPAAPVVNTPTTYCQNTAAVKLTATGTGLKWYMQSTGGTALSTAPVPLTAAAGTTNYYVSQSINGCESVRSLNAVNVNALPVATISSSGLTSFCQGGSVRLTSSIGSSYVWKNGNTQVGTNQTYNAASAGNYTVKVISASDCEATSAVTAVSVTAATIWYSDVDSDGKGDASATKTACSKPTGYVSVAGDLCPADPNKTAAGFCGCGNAETDSDGDGEPDCIDTDDDNDGIADAIDCAPLNAAVGAGSTWYSDVDGDGKGDASATKTACSKPTGYVSVAGDLCPADAGKIVAGDCGCGNTESSCKDCAGVANGTASLDACNACSGGTTGITAIADVAACTTTGIVDLTANDAVKILPNPSNAEFTLLLTNTSNIQVLSADGKLIEIFNEVNSLNFGGTYAKGVYILQISNGSAIQVVRIIKL